MRCCRSHPAYPGWWQQPGLDRAPRFKRRAGHAWKDSSTLRPASGYDLLSFMHYLILSILIHLMTRVRSGCLPLLDSPQGASCHGRETLGILRASIRVQVPFKGCLANEFPGIGPERVRLLHVRCARLTSFHLFLESRPTLASLPTYLIQ